MTGFDSKIVIFEPNIFPYKYPNILYPVILRTYPPMKMEQTQCSETSAYKIQTPGNYPEESTQHSEHSESLKSIIVITSMCEVVYAISDSEANFRYKIVKN